MNGRKPLRVLLPLEIIERTLDLYVERPLQFFAPFLLVSVLTNITGQIVLLLLPPIIAPPAVAESLPSWLTNYLLLLVGALALLGMVFFILSAIGNGVAIKYASDLLERGDADLTAAFNFAIHRLPRLLATGLIYGFLTVLGLVFFVIPGIVVAVMFTLVVPVIIIENKGTFESLERSRRLVDKSWWKTFIVLLIVLSIIGILVIFGESASIYFGTFGIVISILVSAFTQPIYSLSVTYLYYSMRVKEASFQIPIYEPLVEPSIPSQTPILTGQPRFCIHCGQELPSDAIFCPTCGSQIRRYS